MHPRGYHLEEAIFEGPETIVFRGRSDDGRPVLIRTPRDLQAGARRIAHYQIAFNLGRQADPEAVVRPLQLVRSGSSIALVYEDPGGAILSSLVPANGLRLAPLIDLSLAIARSLARLHASGIHHRNVNPANLMVDSRSADTRFLNLDVATKLERGTGAVQPAGQIEGTLAYMSPEQCGRVDSPVDDRADLYSLGVTLFEMATGRVPFEEQDPAALVHAHIARPPPSLEEVRSDIPDPFCEIVERLLQKNTDDRYASAAGLVHDLEICATQFHRSGTVRRFPLGAKDVSALFRLPERLYGRDEELEVLASALDNAFRGERTVVTVSGPSGVGKTAFVNRIQGFVPSGGGRYATGKFDQFKRDQPYLAFIEAARGMLRRELSEAESRLAPRREALQDAMGQYGRLLTDVLPELERIIGPQPEVDEIPPAEAARRFNGVVCRFLAVFAGRDCPLVLFFDDVQWADPASLNLLETLVRASQLGHMLIVLGYRSNEVGVGHQAHPVLNDVRANADKSLEIDLGPLDIADITALIADTLHHDVDEVAALARHVYRVSGGNVFFAREFLSALHERGFFRFDAAQGKWLFDLSDLPAQAVPDNVVDFLTYRLAGLPDGTLDLLDTASCVGSVFRLRTVARVHEIPQSEAAKGLAPAVESGLLVPVGTKYRAFEALAELHLDPDEIGGIGTALYRFQHDQVRQAVHDRLDDRRRAERHLRIGRHLLRKLSKVELETDVVELFNHLAWGVALVEDEQERRDYARIGLMAGRKAQRGLAFETARSQLEVAASLLPKNAWTVDYETALGIHMSLAECAFALGDTDAFNALGDHILDHVRNAIDGARVHGLRIRFLSTRGRYEEALDIGIEVAKGLGVSLPRRPTLLHVLYGAFRAFRAQGGKRALAFENLPECTDRRMREAINILAQALTAAYFSGRNLLPLMGITCALLSIKKGLNPSSPYGFAVWALIQCGVLGRIDNGYDFAKLALAVGRRYGGAEEARAWMVVNTFATHWKEPLDQVANALLESWRLNREAGDEENAVYSGGVLLFTEFFSGKSADADMRYEEIVRYIADSNQPHVQYCLYAWVQLFEALRAPELPEDLQGQWFGYSERLAEFEEARNGVQIAISSVAAGLLDYFAHRHGRAEERFALAAKWKDNIVGQVLVPGLAFFRGLNAFRLYAKAPGSRAWLRLARRQTRCLRRWMVYSPENLGHRVSILEAEDLLARGRENDAVTALHRAADQASGGAVLYRALAERRLAEVFAGMGNVYMAEIAASRACADFEAWGGVALANDLKYGSGVVAGERRSRPARMAVDDGGVGDLDLKSLMTMVGTVSSDVDQVSLFERLMRAILPATNADRGLLILQDDQGLPVVEVAARMSEPVDSDRVPLREFDALARPVVDLALRSQQTVVIDDALSDELTAEDPHVVRSQVRAVLAVCVPVRGETIGLVYLENYVARGAFPEHRVELAEAFGAQAGIATENARLYRRVQDALTSQVRLTEANRRFVPEAVLSRLGYDSIVDVDLNKATEREMSVVFVDLRSFTTISKAIGPQRTIDMINRYLSHVQPGIAANNGFVSNYLGDGLLALFPDGADDAVHGAIALSRGLQGYNRERGDFPELRFGIGIHTGPVILGTIGDPDHLQCSVLGDTVNTASRLEELTKHFDATVLLSGSTHSKLTARDRLTVRYLGRVRVPGRSEQIEVFECLDALPESVREQLVTGMRRFNRAVELYYRGCWADAASLFARSLRECPEDRVSLTFERRCRSRLKEPVDWDGVERISKAI